MNINVFLVVRARILSRTVTGSTELFENVFYTVLIRQNYKVLLKKNNLPISFKCTFEQITCNDNLILHTIDFVKPLFI